MAPTQPPLTNRFRWSKITSATLKSLVTTGTFFYIFFICRIATKLSGTKTAYIPLRLDKMLYFLVILQRFLSNFIHVWTDLTAYWESAMVTSTSTPGSILMDVICLTISDGLCRSISRLWILIWNLSQVFEPSPHGVLRVVMRRTLVGIRTGPFTFRLFSFAPFIRSAHTEMSRKHLKTFGMRSKLVLKSSRYSTLGSDWKYTGTK